MPETQNKFLEDFLEQTQPLTEQIDKLPFETAAELYGMFERAARAAALGGQENQSQARVLLCDRLDKILERVIDTQPPQPQAQSEINVCTPAIQGFRHWVNAELMKDKGLAGYTLAKELGAAPVMYFGSNPADYPYLQALPKMQMFYAESSPDKLAQSYYEHLREHYSQMDVLILHGMYEQTLGYLDVYRKLRPDGKVYCGLDMNKHWMAKIDWCYPDFVRFARQCDVTATSCRSLRDALNADPAVSFACRWLPNGLFNPGSAGSQINAIPEQKENIILTVGRIGTAQKNNAEMLIAFSKAANKLSKWRLRLVGSIEPEFKSFIEGYFLRRPDLKSRVFFTGPITDKSKLYEEYAKAKIFILTSKFEGAPNVYAEALFHGCMFITSDIDAADDITNQGELGAAYKLGDADALAQTMVKMCAKANKIAFKNHIPKALAYAAKYYDWNRNAKKLKIMLFGAAAALN